MKTTVVLVTLGFMLPCMGSAQDNASQGVPQGIKFEFGTTLTGVLSDTVDARKCKPGDPVKARTSEDVKAGGVVVIPRGAKLIGHVTEAQPAAKAGEQARLGLVFDRADLKDGRQIPLHTTFYALAAPEGASSDRDSSLDGGFGGGSGGGSAAVGNMVSAASSTPSDDASALGPRRTRHELKPSPGAIGGLNSSGTLYASSRGVFGLEDISLEPNTVPSSGSYVILANARSVHLASGTRMLLSLESAGKQ
ncbi:MAG TPA: TrbI/VirB10 family protein [Steroidobacteraceae bacterium]|nr:TrbI/VirB10 family protein [Steroidobacteraceae bacterium]